MKLETVVAHVLEPVDADELARVEPGAAAQAGDERVALDQPPELPSRLVRDDGELGARRDRRACRPRRRQAPNVRAPR